MVQVTTVVVYAVDSDDLVILLWPSFIASASCSGSLCTFCTLPLALILKEEDIGKMGVLLYTFTCRALSSMQDCSLGLVAGI